MGAVKTLTRDTFNTIDSAAAYSALTAVLAGVLFTGIVLLVGTKRADGEAEAARAEQTVELPWR